ncbi:MAG: hypothetical protein ABIF89_02300 [bacterium]
MIATILILYCVVSYIVVGVSFYDSFKGESKGWWFFWLFSPALLLLFIIKTGK